MTRSKCVCGNNKEQMADPIEDCDDLCSGSVLALNDQHGTCQCQNETHTSPSDLASGETHCACVVESPEGDGCCHHAGTSTGSDKVSAPKCVLGGSPPNGCISRFHTLDDNGIVKVTEHSIRECLTDADNGSPNACTSASDMATEEATSNITTDSEECPTPSTDKTQLSDSESPAEDGSKAGSPDVSTLCDDLANTSISNPAQNQPESETTDTKLGIDYVVYESELQMKHIMRLITKDLSEPYSIYTYRYFIHNWPKLCFLAMDRESGKCVGAIVCKLDVHKKLVRRGYIAMLAVDQQCRRRGIGSHLVLKAIKAMVDDECDEVVLETEITNKAALHLYENLGFVRDKRLFRYYLNGVDALRLKLWLK